MISDEQLVEESLAGSALAFSDLVERYQERLLNQDAYAAMWLRYVEDMSIKEIARALDKTQSWTKVTLLRGRRSLSAELTEGTSAAAGRQIYGRI